MRRTKSHRRRQSVGRSVAQSTVTARSVCAADDAAVAKRDRHVGDRGDLGIVGDEDERRPARAVDLEQQVDDVAAGRAVEVAGRLVGQQDRRVVGERARDRDALLLAARELRRIVMAAIRRGPTSPSSASRAPRRARRRRRSRSARARSRTRSATAADGRTGTRTRCACRAAAPARPRSSAGDVDAVDDDRAGRRRVEARDQPEQRRLAAARRAGDRDDAPARDR